MVTPQQSTTILIDKKHQKNKEKTSLPSYYKYFQSLMKLAKKGKTFTVHFTEKR